MKKKYILDKIQEQVARGVKNPNLGGDPVGLKITKQALKKSKEENDSYHKELEKKFKDYLKLDVKDNPSPKVNMTDSDHKMYYGTGMEGLKYDDEGTEKNKKFLERNKKLNEPSKDYYLNKDGVEDSYGKIMKDGETYKKHKYEKPDEYQKTPKVRITKESTNKKTMKQLNFKKPFPSQEKTMNLIPESFKFDRNKFAMTDGVETYTIRWEGDDKGSPVVLKYKNENLVKEDVQKIQHLYDYKSEETLMKTNDALTENQIFRELLGKSRSLVNEQAVPAPTSGAKPTGTTPAATTKPNSGDKPTDNSKPIEIANNFDVKTYKNPDINNINKLKAFKDFGVVDRNNFPSLANSLNKKLQSDSISKEEVGNLFRTFDKEKLSKFLTNFLDYIAKSKTPTNTDAIRIMLDGPLKNLFVWFNTFKFKDTGGEKEYYAVTTDNVGTFRTELLSFVTKQIEKAKKVV